MKPLFKIESWICSNFSHQGFFPFFFTIIFFIIYSRSTAQNTFQKSYGGESFDVGYSGEQTEDGGYILTGCCNSVGAGDYNVYLVKTNANGDTAWTSIFGGTDTDGAMCVSQTEDDGYIITGATYSFGAGDYDIYVNKTDSNGVLLWSRTFGGTGADYAYFGKQTSDGGYIISGVTSGFGVNFNSSYLIKLNANGDTLWTKILTGINSNSGFSIEETYDGGFIIAGGFLIKTDSNGNVLWSRLFDGLGDRESVEQLTDSGFFITGTHFFPNDYDVCCIRTDVNGDTLWTRSFGGTNADQGYSGRQTSEGGFILTGYTLSFGAGERDVYLIRTDASGDTLWTRTYGGTSLDQGSWVQQTADGGFIIVGQEFGFGAGYGGVYLIKTDANGYSGCNENSTATVVGSSGILVSSPAVIAHSVPTIVTIPNTQVGRGGAYNTICTTVNTEELSSKNSWLISPNPSQGIFHLSTSSKYFDGKISVSNQLGEIILEKLIQNLDMVELDLSAQVQGIYLIRFETKEESQITRVSLIK